MSTRSGNETSTSSALGPVPRAEDVIARMKEAAGVKTDTELAGLLGTTRSNVTKWRKRNSIPYAEALEIAIKSSTPLDYILLGIKRFSQMVPIRELDIELFRLVVAIVLLPYTRHEKGKESELESLFTATAKEIAKRYSDAQLLIDAMTKDGAVTVENARGAAILAAKAAFERELAETDEEGPQQGPQNAR